MLANLHVKNFAIIDEADVDLTDNLNIFTGETGAGKSLLLGALNMALGARTLKDIVRNDADYALCELTFSGISDKVAEILEEQDIECSDELVISKKLLSNGRSVVRVNGETVPASFVKVLGGSLVDIYGQNEHQSLVRAEKQLELVDEYAGAEAVELKAKVKVAFSDYLNLKKQIDGLLDDEGVRNRKADLLEYEINEIEAANLCEGEEEALKERHKLLANSRLIKEGIEGACSYIDDEDGAEDRLSSALRCLNRVTEYDERLNQLFLELSELDSSLCGCIREMHDYCDELPDSREELEETEERLDLISRLKSKYGSTVSKIEEYRLDAVCELEKLRDFEGYQKKIRQDYEQAYEKLSKLCTRLSEIRITAALQLEKSISEALLELNFNQVSFHINILEKDECHGDGKDSCCFVISLNPGETPRPLGDVASGGELSRIMLGIKSVMAGKSGTDTLLFDEIDAGISGRTAQMVSEKLCRIAGNHQVICITHLPQIAAMADSHYEIVKKVDDGKTATNIRQLKDSEMIDELARLLGGARITESVMASAKEMKELAKARRGELRSF